jgi:glycosyltransferase involved in cell wall biosynthesis
MKVLHVLSELKFSGAELMLYSAARIFKEQGLDVNILATGQNEGVFAKYFRDLGWEVYHLPCKKNFSFFYNLRKLINVCSFDIIHFHTEEAFIYMAISAHLGGAKMIVGTVHANFSFSLYFKYRRIFHHYLAKKMLNVTFTSISEAVKTNEYQVFKTDTVLIKNWIDTNKFNNKNKLTIKEEDLSILHKIKFVSVGMCSSNKNHIAILKLLQTLINRGISCHYLHIGCGELEEFEQAWVRDNDLQQYVTFVSQTDRVQDYLINCNIYLMPSMVEGLSIACLEAMAAGLLCIVNDVPGLNTLIEHGRTGYVVDFNQVEVVADLIASISEGPIKMDELSKEAQIFVEKNYSLSNARQYVDLYFSVLPLKQKEFVI